MKAQLYFLALLMLSGSVVLGQTGRIHELQRSLPAQKDSANYVDIINRISLLYYEQNVDSTLYYAALAREISTRHDYAKGLADATNNLGVVFDINGNTQLALRFYNDAYTQYKSLRDSSNMVQTLMNIGMVYQIMKKDEKAGANLKRALDLGNRISQDSITALAIYNYLLLYPRHFTEEDRSRHLDKANRIALKYRDKRMEMAISQLRADDMISGGKRNEGIALLKRTLDSSLQAGLFYFSMDLMIELGDLYLPIQADTGIVYLQNALRISEERGYRQYSMAICKKLADHHHNKADGRSAYIYSRKLVALYEHQEAVNRESGIDYIQYMMNEQELKSAKLNSQHDSRLLALAVAICTLTILVIIFLLRNWKLSKNTNHVLTMQFHQLEITTEALEKSNRNYARLIKTVAHDLRNPIGGIEALSKLMLEHEMSDKESREFIEVIQVSSHSCLNLISDLMQTDFEVRESELQKEEIHVRTFLEHIILLLKFRANEKKQQLTLGQIPLKSINADREKLSRVITNLIINSIKFTPNGGSIHVAASQEEDQVVFSVKDTGMGIPKAATTKIFDPFTTAKRPGTLGEQPFGLGLYISKQIVEAHHGRIHFETEEGAGTTFYISLPTG